jgi:hypothetical protein
MINDLNYYHIYYFFFFFGELNLLSNDNAQTPKS